MSEDIDRSMEFSNQLLGKSKRIKELELQLSEARLALEIAHQGMVHTFSGHTYKDGKPVEFVDGCCKCRVEKCLAASDKRVEERSRSIEEKGDGTTGCGA